MNENLMIKEIKEKIEELRFNEHYINDNYVDIYKLHKILDEYLKIEATRINMMMKQIQIQHKQLQSYKQKEDKLREYLTNTEFEERTAYDTSFCEGVYNTKEKALQILNEGSDKNEIKNFN